MDSGKLSARLLQPGHFKNGQEAEERFLGVAREGLDSTLYDVISKPSDLDSIFGPNPETGRSLGIRPDASIRSTITNRRFFVEIKWQNERGNAEERAYKHHTTRFTRLLKEKYGLPFHPFVTIFSGPVAGHAKYATKFAGLVEPDHYFLWPPPYDSVALCAYLSARCRAWLD